MSILVHVHLAILVVYHCCCGRGRRAIIHSKGNSLVEEVALVYKLLHLFKKKIMEI